MLRKWFTSPDCILATVTLLIGVFIVVQASKMEDFGVSLESPGITPAFAGTVIMLCSVIIGINGWRTAGSGGAQTPTWNLATWIKDASVKRVAVIFGATVLYAVLVPHLHFLATTVLFLVGTLWVYRAGRLSSVLGIALGVGLCIQFVFARLFRVMLP